MQRSITLEVTGDHRMSCEGCEQRVQNAIKTLAGIAKVRANARNQRINVLFDATKLESVAIAERIKKTRVSDRNRGPCRLGELKGDI